MYITLSYYDVVVVTSVRFFLVSPVRLSRLHRSSGEPRPTSYIMYIIKQHYPSRFPSTRQFVLDRHPQNTAGGQRTRMALS